MSNAIIILTKFKIEVGTKTIGYDSKLRLSHAELLSASNIFKVLDFRFRSRQSRDGMPIQ